MLLEPHGALVDDLADTMAADEDAAFRIDGARPAATAARLVDEQTRGPATSTSRAPSAQARFWYVSEEKLEPRLGERAEEPGAELEKPLATARDALALRAALIAEPADTRSRRFCCASRTPPHRAPHPAVRRATPTPRSATI